MVPKYFNDVGILLFISLLQYARVWEIMFGKQDKILVVTARRRCRYIMQWNVTKIRYNTHMKERMYLPII